MIINKELNVMSELSMQMKESFLNSGNFNILDPLNMIIQVESLENLLDTQRKHCEYLEKLIIVQNEECLAYIRKSINLEKQLDSVLKENVELRSECEFGMRVLLNE